MKTPNRFTKGSGLRQYLLAEMLSEDAIGSLWKAHDSVLGRDVALKILKPELTSDAEHREFITSEARVAGHLDHPAIAKVYELDQVGGDLFIVYEIASGELLSGLVHQSPLGRERFANLAIQMTEAIHAAHLADVIHGNLHTWDFVVDSDDQVKVFGFGTGRASTTLRPAVELAEKAEQAFYFSPERVAGRALQIVSDVFSLGSIFYEMATGRIPFPGATAEEVCSRVVNAPPPAPQLYNRTIDPLVVAIIGRCIHKEAGRRYQSAAHVLLDLAKLGGPAGFISGSYPHHAARPSLRPVSSAATRVAESAESETPRAAPPSAQPPAPDLARPPMELDAPPVSPDLPRRTFALDIEEDPPLAIPQVPPRSGVGSTAIPAVSRTHETPQATSDLGPGDVSSSVLDALAQLDTTVVREEQKPPSERSVRTEYETNIVNARMTVVLFASLPGPPTSNDDPVLARLPGRMQQILGEAVYLYGGHIVDPFGSRMIAEFEDASSAVQAARKGREDLESHNAGQSNRFLHIQARLVVHAGEARTAGGQVSGPVVDAAQAAVAALPPLVPAVSATVLGLLGIHPDGPPIATAPEPFYNLPAETVEPVEPEPDMERTLVAPARPAERRRTPLIIAAIGALIVLFAIVGGGLAWMSAKKRAAALEARRQAASAAPKKIAAPAMTVRQIAVDPFWVEVADPKVSAPPAEAIRLAVIGILESSPELRIVDSPAGADKFGASIIQSASGVELIPMRIAPQAERGRAVPYRDTAQAAGMLARWISDRVSVAPPLFTNTSAETMELFARAVAEKRSAGSQVTPQLAALAKSLAKADPSFVPGQLLALDVFERQRIESDAIIAANAVLAVDPRNVAVRKRLAALQARSGQPGEALAQFVEVYKAEPGDVEAVQAIAIYALAANDRIVFDRMRALLEEMGAPRRLHTPDLLLVEGKIDQAASPLFELESAEPNNPALALKIGRVAVLRRMMSIADIELRKLRTLDPAFGYPMLHAYVLAERRDRANALVELERAISAARWDDLPYTRAAEVYAILGSAQGVIESLEKAVERGEPSGAYILNNPLFRFLSRDGRFVRLRDRMDGQMKGVRAALATVPI